MKLASAALQYVVVALVVASGARGAQAGVDAGLSEEEVISESLFVDGPRQGHQPLHLRHRSEDDLPSVTSDTWDEGRARQLRYQRKRRHNAYVMTSSPANSAEASPRASTTLPASSNSISSLQSRTNNGTFVLFSTGELGFLLTGQTTPQPLGFFIDETRNRELYLPNGNSDGTRQYFGIFWNGADGFVNGAGTAVSFEISGTTTTTTTTTNSTNTTSTGGGGGGGGTVINTGGGTIVISDFDSNSNNDSGPETDSGPDETSSNDLAGSGCQQYGSSNRSSSSSSSSSSRSSSSSSSSSTSSSRNRRYGKGKGGKRKGKGGYRWSRELKKSKSGKGKGKGKGKGNGSYSSSSNSNSNSNSHSNAHYVYYHHGQPSDDSEPCG